MLWQSGGSRALGLTMKTEVTKTADNTTFFLNTKHLSLFGPLVRFCPPSGLLHASWHVDIPDCLSRRCLGSPNVHPVHLEDSDYLSPARLGTPNLQSVRLEDSDCLLQES